MRLSVVILTGTREGPHPLLVGTRLRNKVLLPLAGRPMLEWVLEAVVGSRFSAQTFLSGHDPEVLPEMLKVKTALPFAPLPSGTSAVQSIRNALERLPDDEWVLFITGDHPLLTGEMIDYFVDEAVQEDLDLAVAVVNAEQLKATYPKSRRTLWAVKNGAYSCGNLFLIRCSHFNPHWERLEALERNRKQPWRILPQLGLRTAMSLLFRRMDILALSQWASAWIGCRAGAVEMPWPVCCMDVDKPSDQSLAEEILEARLVQQKRLAALKT